ncbi:MAG: Hsp20/alpha crystallin family protein [Candidatus Pacebacteria bacterium]|nr:Hsp20/alpha crystallin family protein [Candidatus Paceibacterota bacterium]
MSYFIPRSLMSLPGLGLSSFFDDDAFGLVGNVPNGLSLAEDDKHVYVEAAVPGVYSKDIDVLFEKGVLRIVAEGVKEEKEGKKYFRRASSSFSYQVAVPGEIDLSVEPEAEIKNGVMHITFVKSPKTQPKKISVKSAK